MRPREELLSALLAGEELPDEEADVLLHEIDSDAAFCEAAGDEAFVHGLLTAALGGRLRARRARLRPRSGRRRVPLPVLAASAAAVLAVAAAGWMVLGGRYPAPEASGSFEIVGGGELRRGAVVLTRDARASVALGGYCRVDLEPASRMKLGGKESAEAVFLERGTVACEVDRGRGAFAVETEAGTASAAGTSFTVRVIEEEEMPGKRMHVKVLAGAVVLTGVWGELALAAGGERTVPGHGIAHVNNVKVVSDKVEDVTTIEALLDWMIKPGMSEREKALAVWETVVKFRHQDAPPSEFCLSDNVQDPIKTFNVYGYGMCSCASSNIEALARAAGFQARGRGINRHSVPEVFYDEDWHLLDASLLNYFLDKGGDLASVDEIIASVRAWYDKNPGYEGNDKKLVQFMRNNGWKNGPDILASSEFYDANGWLPAATHGWYSTMGEYNGKPKFVYEYGYSMGYRALLRLRPGEVLTRNWFNKGLHVNMDGSGGAPGCLKGEVGKGDMRYAPKYGDIAPGRIGNGTLRYTVPLSGADWRPGAWRLDNVAARPGIRHEDGKKAAEAVFRMRCPYVFLTGKVSIGGRRSAGASVALLLSTNNGLDWKEVWRLDKSGHFAEEVDLGKRVLRRYDYLVKLVLEGGARIDELEFENDVQHSQRAMPALAQGKNAITVSAGPATETITVAPSLKQDVGGKNEVLSDSHATVEGARFAHGGVWCADYGTPAFVTIPVETPGDIAAVRFGGHFRARGNRDGIELQLSFDGGGSWVEAGKAWGPYAGFCKYVEYDKVPEGKRRVLVRYKLTQGNNTTGIMGLRADVDYWDTPDGKRPKKEAFRPLKVTYVWQEDGVEKGDVRVVRKPRESYEIDCAGAPLMRSLIVELAE